MSIKIKILLDNPSENHKPFNEYDIPGTSDPLGAPKSWTQAAFCRAIDVDSHSFSDFIKAKTAMGGHSGVYSGAYAFFFSFEKKRI